MTETEFAQTLTDAINLQLDLPFLNEDGERRVIYWAVSKVAEFIPADMRQLFVDASDGLDDEELERLKAFVVSFLNRAIDIPMFPEILEANLFEAVVDAVFGFARKGLSIA